MCVFLCVCVYVCVCVCVCVCVQNINICVSSTGYLFEHYLASWHLNLSAILVISGVSCSLFSLTHKKIYIIHVICILYLGVSKERKERSSVYLAEAEQAKIKFRYHDILGWCIYLFRYLAKIAGFRTQFLAPCNCS